MGHYFLDSNTFWNQKPFFEPKNFFGLKIIFEVEIFFGPKNLLDLKLSLSPKIVFGPNPSFGPNVFGQKFFLPKIFSDSKAFQTQIFFDPKRSSLVFCFKHTKPKSFKPKTFQAGHFRPKILLLCCLIDNLFIN